MRHPALANRKKPDPELGRRFRTSHTNGTFDIPFNAGIQSTCRPIAAIAVVAIRGEKDLLHVDHRHSRDGQLFRGGHYVDRAEDPGRLGVRDERVASESPVVLYGLC